MIRVNGVPLDNPQFGWVLRPKSVPYTAVERDLQQVDVRGWDGNVPTPSSFTAPFLLLQINTPPSGLETLQALFRGDLVLTRDDHPGVEARARLASSNFDRFFPRNEWIDVSYVVEIPGAYWRSQTESTFAAPVNAASVPLTCWPADDPEPPFWVTPGPDVQFVLWDSVPTSDPSSWVILREGGLSAPVHDAVIRVKGSATGIRLSDAAGSWLALPNVSAGEWVRFESATGRCFKTTSDTWSGGTDVSGQVDFGGPRDVFEITPVLATGDPSSRKGVVTVTTASRSGAVVEVRGKAAYLI